jgi:hypothetical protein
MSILVDGHQAEKTLGVSVFLCKVERENIVTFHVFLVKLLGLGVVGRRAQHVYRRTGHFVV